LAACYTFPLRPWPGHYTDEVANYVTSRPHRCIYDYSTKRRVPHEIAYSAYFRAHFAGNSPLIMSAQARAAVLPRQR